MPEKLWRFLKKQLPKPPKKKGPGRPRVISRDVLDGIWYVLWTGCQWESIEKEWFGVSSSVLHERFQTWRKQGVFDKLFKKMVQYLAREHHIAWKWKSADSMMAAAPLGRRDTGKECSIPAETTFPARRWVVERTFGWLAKRRSIATRWCRNVENWLAFIKMACADILINAIFG